MINKTFISQLKKDYRTKESERRQIISLSNNVLFHSKKAIFALHRNDLKIADEKLLEMENELLSLEKKFTIKRIEEEGAYRAAVEEYTEAKLLSFAIKGEKIDKIKKLKLSTDAYLGGICDLLGELVRVATNEAAAGNFKRVTEVKELSENIMDQLIDFDMTGYLRTKYDQARGHLRKLEQMAYEIKLRVGK
ncbi:MAG: translin family protein [Patescibacteria group bacterium]